MTNCVCEVYLDYATFHTAVELVDDTKFLAAFVTKDGKIVLVKKT